MRARPRRTAAADVCATSVCAAAGLVLLFGIAAAAFGQTAPVPSQASPEVSDATRLAFPPGATRITVVGDDESSGPVRYLIDLSEGQPLILHLDSTLMGAELRVVDPSTGREIAGSGQGTADFRGLVPARGDYLVLVSTVAQAPGGARRGGVYRLTVEAPATVRFGLGGVSAARSGPTPGGLPVDYLLQGKAGSTLLLDLTATGGELSLEVSELSSRRILFDSKPSERIDTAVRLPVDAAYLVTVVPAFGADATYRLDMVVPAIALPANPSYLGFPGPGHIVIVVAAGSPSGLSRKLVASSIDNGLTWREAVSPVGAVGPGEVADLPTNGRIVGVGFPSATDGFMSLSVERQPDGSLGPWLYGTTDGGATWFPVELPLPGSLEPVEVAALLPSAPQFSDESRGSLLVEVRSRGGSSVEVRYLTRDGGNRWSIEESSPALGAPGPVVPDAVGARSALAACLSEDQVAAGLKDSTRSQRFAGAAIGAWVARLAAGLAMPVAPLEASVSPDGRRLAVALVGCHPSRGLPLPFTIFAVIDAHGKVSYLHDRDGREYFDGFFTANSEGLYRLYGWLAAGSTVLINAAPFNLGAGGSCQSTRWMAEGADGRMGAAFRTVNQVFAAKGNALLFYVAPDGCRGMPHEIHEVRTATGQDTIVYQGSSAVGIEVTGVSERADGMIELRYRENGGGERRLTLP